MVRFGGTPFEFDRAIHGSYFGVTPSGQNTHGEGVFKTRNGECHYEQESMWNTGVKY